MRPIRWEGKVGCVIYSSTISAANPELRRAVEFGIPRLSYAEMLGLLMLGHCGLPVAGTHGKSTATAMAAEILVAAGCDPTVMHTTPPKFPLPWKRFARSRPRHRFAACFNPTRRYGRHAHWTNWP